MLKLVVLISGAGRNLQAIHAAITNGSLNACILAVISNKADAGGVVYAQQHGITTHVIPHTAYDSREAFDGILAKTIDTYSPDIVVLAGFMRVLSSGFVQHYEGKLLNIHPSLLPKFKGLRTHEQALAAGETRHGATVHYVTADLDSGAAVLQGSLNITPQHTAHSLAQDVMQHIETYIYPEVLRWLAQGRLRWQAGQVYLDGVMLNQPVLHTHTLL